MASFSPHALLAVSAQPLSRTSLPERKSQRAYDGVMGIFGGVFFNGNIMQPGVQLLEAVIGFTWSFCAPYLLIALNDCVPGLEVLAEGKLLLAG